MHQPLIDRQPFRVFAGGVGPTRRGANMHRKAESLRYSTMVADA